MCDKKYNWLIIVRFYVEVAVTILKFRISICHDYWYNYLGLYQLLNCSQFSVLSELNTLTFQYRYLLCFVPEAADSSFGLG